MFQKNKKQDEEYMGRYWEAVKKKYVPLLTLDPRWHQLFPDHMKTKRMIQLEKKLNKLIKKQGQTNNDLKDYEKTREEANTVINAIAKLNTVKYVITIDGTTNVNGK